MLLKNKIKNLSVPVQYEIQPFMDDRFKKVRILVMHDGLNLNGSVFNMDSIEHAKDSIKNIPILAFVKQQDGNDGGDFAGHESELVITSEGEMKFRYLGRPIGIVPADACDYHYEIHDGKTYVAVTAYIWTDYANEALSILERDGDKSQSMEIRIDDGDWDDNDNFNISKYRYTGLTLLGDDVRPAMVGAKCSMYSLSETFSADFYDMIEELNQSLQNYTFTDDENHEDNNDNGNQDNDDSTFNDEGQGGENQDNDNQDDQSGNQDNDGEFSDDNKPSLEDTIETLNNQIFELNTQMAKLNTDYTELQSKYDTLNAETERLRVFESDINKAKEKTAKVNLINDYANILSSDEMESVVKSIDELSLIEIKTQLNEIYTEKNLLLSKKNKFSSENKEGISIDIPKKEDIRSRYAI